MMGRIAAILAGALVGGAAAAEPAALRALFPSEADLFVDRPGLIRLDLPPEVLAACRTDLSNLRLFDPDGQEIPFLLDAPPRGSVREVETAAAPSLEVRREESPRDGAAAVRREIYEIAGPGRAARTGAWALVLDAVPPEFVARIEVRPAGGGAATRGSIFRLGAPRRAEKLRLPVGAAKAERLEVVIEHEQPFWLEPAFRFESATTFAFGAATAIPLEILARRSTGGTTVIELARPRGVVPEALRLATRTPTFDRRILVHDERPGKSASPLADGNLFRLLPATGVEELELPIGPARGDRLRVVIEDGDSPPLESASFSAVFAQPSLVASVTAPGGPAPAAVLRFGGERARVPRYDLAGLRPAPGREVYGRRAEALLRLYDPSAVARARLGPIRPNPEFDRAPALAFAMRPGAVLDSRSWAVRRPLAVAPSAEGLTRIRLGAEDLARLRPDLGDLRVVDAASRQWPYLVERDGATTEVPYAIAATTSKDRATTYELEAAIAPVLLERLLLDVDAPFFDRPFRLRAQTEDGTEVVLAQGRLARRAGDEAPVAVGASPTRVRRLALRIEDGDDAPLALRSAHALSPVADVFVTAPPGQYFLLSGCADALPPSYELERVRDVVLALEAPPNTLGPAEKNPGFSATARLVRGKGREQALLWGAIVAAVVVLAALTLRLARRERA